MTKLKALAKKLLAVRSKKVTRRKTKRKKNSNGNCKAFCVKCKRNKLKNRFKVFKNEEEILERQFVSICPVGASPGILYSNLKVNTAVVNKTSKFRPFLLAINAPTYLLITYSNFLFSPLTANDYTVENSFDFVEEVANYNHNFHVAILDIKSLFTGITLEESIKKVCQRFIFN